MSDFVIKNGVLIKYIGDEPEVVVPDGITEIKNEAFAFNEKIKNVIISQNIKKIGNKAFYYCGSLENITLNEGLVEIGNEAFSDCKKLKSIILPKGLEIIGSYAFKWCVNLDNVTFPEGIKKIGREAFHNCKSMKSVVIPGSVEKIESETFTSCTELEELVLSDGIKEIGKDAFFGCKKLQSVVIPKSVSVIGESAFLSCHSLQNLDLQSDSLKISKYAFGDCEKLADDNGFVIVNDILYGYYGESEDVIIPENVKAIEDQAFMWSKIKQVKIPDGVTRICAEVFYGCENLEEVVIPKSVLSIGQEAFYKCKNLKSITVSGSVSKTGDGFISGTPGIQYIICNKKSRKHLNWEKLFKISAGIVEKDEKGIAFFAYSSGKSSDNFTDFVNTGKWNAYDIDIINNGPCYKYKAEARFLGALGRLNDPVDLTDECKELYVELLVKNAKKLIPIAEEIGCPEIIEMMIKHKIINDGNRKSINKLLKASANEKIAAFAE